MTHEVKLYASTAARRMVCPGSWRLEQKYRKPKTDAALEGDAAHWVATQYITTGEMPAENSICPNGELVTNEMIEGAILYDDARKKISGCESTELKCEYIEVSLKADIINPALVIKPDLFSFVGTTLYVFDYKFGHGYVNTYENYQLLEYAIGILENYDPHIENIVLVIVQPRNYHREGQVRKWELPRETLFNKYLPILIEGENKALDPNALFTPSPECGNCDARHACTTLQENAVRVVDIVRRNSAVDLTPNELGNELRLLQHAKDLLDARVDGLEAEALAQLQQGKSIPFYHCEQGMGREVWSKPIEEIKTLAEVYGVAVVKPDTLITPAQAIKAGLPESITKSYTNRPYGKMKLVQDDVKKLSRVFDK